MGPCVSYCSEDKIFLKADLFRAEFHYETKVLKMDLAPNSPGAGLS